VDQMTSDQVFWIVTGVLVVLTFGGFGSYVASEKNRHWAEGFIFGAVMGPLGVIAAACLPTREPRFSAMPDRPMLADTPAGERYREEDLDEDVDVEELAAKLKKSPLSPLEQRLAVNLGPSGSDSAKRNRPGPK
jgi:hypothetical protein